MMMHLSDSGLFYVEINISNTNIEYMLINYCSNQVIESIELYDNDWSIIYEDFIQQNCLSFTYPEYIENSDLNENSYYIVIYDNSTSREFNLTSQCFTNTSIPGLFLKKTTMIIIVFVCIPQIFRNKMW